MQLFNNKNDKLNLVEEQEEIISKYEKENQVINLNETLINEQSEKINEIVSNLYN